MFSSMGRITQACVPVRVSSAASQSWTVLFLRVTSRKPLTNRSAVTRLHVCFNLELVSDRRGSLSQAAGAACRGSLSQAAGAACRGSFSQAAGAACRGSLSQAAGAARRGSLSQAAGAAHRESLSYSCWSRMPRISQIYLREPHAEDLSAIDAGAA